MNRSRLVMKLPGVGGQMGKMLQVLLGAVCFSVCVGMPVQAQVADGAEDTSAHIHDLTVQAKKGSAEAQYRLGVIYLEGDAVSQDILKGVKLIRSAAKQNLAEAQNMMGELCFYGVEGVPENEQEAARWYRLAAEQGSSEAQHSLGWMYQAGQGVGQDYAEAVRFYALAASKGYPSAQNNLGSMYQHGQGVPRNYKKARVLYYRAARQGEGLAFVNLGALYQHGLGVKQDYKKAVRFYRIAVREDVGIAYNSLGLMYLDGLYFRRDVKKAESFFRQAAQREVGFAYRNLAQLYEAGDSQKNPVAAYALFGLGYRVDPTDTMMQQQQKEVADKLSPEILKIAQQLEQNMAESDDFLVVLDKFVRSGSLPE